MRKNNLINVMKQPPGNDTDEIKYKIYTIALLFT